MPGLTSFASPRFSVNWLPGNKIRYFATAGLFHQSPRYLQLAANESNALKTEEITHSSIGFEFFPYNTWSLLTEAYHQNLDKLVVDLDRVSGTFANIGDGTSYGVDIVPTIGPSRRMFDKSSCSTPMTIFALRPAAPLRSLR